MSDWHEERRTAEHAQANPDHNPAKAELEPEVGSGSRWLYLGPVIALLVIIGIALLYWTTRDARTIEQVTPVGTAGEATAGGGDPAPKPDNTQNELDARQDPR